VVIRFGVHVHAAASQIQLVQAHKDLLKCKTKHKPARTTATNGMTGSNTGTVLTILTGASNSKCKTNHQVVPKAISLLILANLNGIIQWIGHIFHSIKPNNNSSSSSSSNSNNRISLKLQVWYQMLHNRQFSSNRTIALGTYSVLTFLSQYCLGSLLLMQPVQFHQLRT